MAEPAYLTDAERPLRAESMRDRYRYVAVFRFRDVQYTRWFADPTVRDAYLTWPGILIMDTGEAPTTAAVTLETKWRSGSISQSHREGIRE